MYSVTMRRSDRSGQTNFVCRICFRNTPWMICWSSRLGVLTLHSLTLTLRARQSALVERNPFTIQRVAPLMSLNRVEKTVHRKVNCHGAGIRWQSLAAARPDVCGPVRMV